MSRLPISTGEVSDAAPADQILIPGELAELNRTALLLGAPGYFDDLSATSVHLPSEVFGVGPESSTSPTPADEIFTLYGLERFLARLADTPVAEDFCLKGGVLLSAHALGRPTPDVDMQALDFQLDVVVDDGLVFDRASMQIEQIRDEDEYTGLRVSLSAVLGRARITIKLDISTGDPIWPEPEQMSDRFQFDAADCPHSIASRTLRVKIMGPGMVRTVDRVRLSGEDLLLAGSR